MEKIIVYTANIGHYDKVRDPLYKDPNVQYILFTDDKNLTSKIWDVRYVDYCASIDNDLQRVARYFKLCPDKVLPKHDISIWVDGKYEINLHNVKQFIERNLVHDIACYTHHNGNRDCIYQEAKVCIDNRLDSESVINRQIDRYRKNNFPEHYGLCDTAIMIRRNNYIVRLFNERWKAEIDFGSKRDQLSQMFISWLSSVSIDRIRFGGDVSYRSQFFIKHPHRVKR